MNGITCLEIQLQLSNAPSKAPRPASGGSRGSEILRRRPWGSFDDGTCTLELSFAPPRLAAAQQIDRGPARGARAAPAVAWAGARGRRLTWAASDWPGSDRTTAARVASDSTCAARFTPVGQAGLYVVQTQLARTGRYPP